MIYYNTQTGLLIRKTEFEDGSSNHFVVLQDPANSDFMQFKKDLANGAELQDAEGNVIDGIAYLEELV